MSGYININEVSHHMDVYHIYAPADYIPAALPGDGISEMLCGKKFEAVVNANEGAIDLGGHLKLGAAYHNHHRVYPCSACLDEVGPLDILGATEL